MHIMGTPTAHSVAHRSARTDLSEPARPIALLARSRHERAMYSEFYVVPVALGAEILIRLITDVLGDEADASVAEQKMAASRMG